MAAKPANVDIIKKANREFAEAQNRKKELLKTYKEEPKVAVYLSPMYRAYFGNVMRVSVNGISIYFAVDGSTQIVPQTFADVITERRIAIDSILNKQNMLADVHSNVETSPGEINLF